MPSIAMMSTRRIPVAIGLVLGPVVGLAGLGPAPLAAQVAPPCIVSGLDAVDAAACELASLLETDFVLPEQGAAYAAMLREAVGQGRYTGLDASAAAAAMTRDLQHVARDGHLKVMVAEEGTPVRRDRTRAKVASVFPYGGGEPVPVFEDAGWIAPGIAFLRLNEFSYDPTVLRQIAQFMADHAQARALVLDMRTNHGGGLEAMDLILPWLYAEPTRLLTLQTARSMEARNGAMFADQRSITAGGDARTALYEHWAIPLADARLRRARVMVLTGPASNSAAEAFALSLKRTGRATLVGERTRGANHFGGPVPLSGGLEAWIPVGRTFDPETGQDWEGRGVEPDIAVPAGDALARALVELGIAPEEAHALSAAHRPRLPLDRPRG